MRRPHGASGVRSPDRSVRMQPGSFTQDPGMRARDQFTDVASPGYREQAKRVAEGGGAKQYATSVEEEQAAAETDNLRTQIMIVLLSLMGIGGPAGAVGRAAAPMSAFQRGTLGQVGANPGLGRSVLGTPSARQAAANRGLQTGGGDTLSVLDHALGGTPAGRTVGWSSPALERGPRLMDTPLSRWLRR